MIKQFSENGPVGVLKPCCTTAAYLTRALTGARPIKFTSPRCPSAWQPNHGRRSTYRRGKTVQTTETTSDRRNALMTFIVQRSYLVVVAVPTAEAARRIFTVLNARALDLTPTDLWAPHASSA